MVMSQHELEKILASQLQAEFDVQVERGWEFKEVSNLEQSSINEHLLCHFERVNVVAKGDLSRMGVDFTDTHWNDAKQVINPSAATTGLVADGTKIVVEAGWLIAADGGHSTVRRMLQIPFDGVATTKMLDMVDI